MKLPREHIEAVASREDSRYTLGGVLFDAERGLLVATDGHVLAAIPAEAGKGDQTGLISNRAWQLARAAAKRIPKKFRKTMSASFQVLKHKIILRGYDETTVLPKLTGQFPKWTAIMSGLNPSVSIAINVDLLYNLSLALCDPATPAIVTLFIEAKDKVVAVVPSNGDGIGMLMPCRNNNECINDRMKSLKLPITKKL